MYCKFVNGVITETSTIPVEGYEPQGDWVDVGWKKYDEFVVPPFPGWISEKQRIEGLWQAAHDYEFASVNGSGVGLVTMGVLQGLPKALSVQLWVKSIWAEYYLRKANGSQNLDFSVVGNCPHSIPELMSELGI